MKQTFGTKWIMELRSREVYLLNMFEHALNISDVILYQCISWLLYRVQLYFMLQFNAFNAQ